MDDRGTATLVEDEEDIAIHAVTLGAGYEHPLSEQFSLFGEVGLGRYFTAGADGVNGHVIGSLQAGVRWGFSQSFSALLGGGVTFGSAHLHAGEGEADLRGTWALLLGFELQL